MSMLESKCTMKPSSIGYPTFYLGSNVGKVLYVNGSYAWTMSFYFFVKEAINTMNKRPK